MYTIELNIYGENDYVQACYHDVSLALARAKREIKSVLNTIQNSPEYAEAKYSIKKSYAKDWPFDDVNWLDDPSQCIGYEIVAKTDNDYRNGTVVDSAYVHYFPIKDKRESDIEHRNCQK